MSGPGVSLNAVLKAVIAMLPTMSKGQVTQTVAAMKLFLQQSATKNQEAQLASVLQACTLRQPSQTTTSVPALVKYYGAILKCIENRSFVYHLRGSAPIISSSTTTAVTDVQVCRMLETLFLEYVDSTDMKHCLDAAKSTAKEIVPCLGPYVSDFNEDAGEKHTLDLFEDIAMWVGIAIAAIIVLYVLYKVVVVIKDSRKKAALQGKIEQDEEDIAQQGVDADDYFHDGKDATLL